VRAALAEADPTAPTKRRELAKQHDWDAIVQRMGALIADAASEKKADPNGADG